MKIFKTFGVKKFDFALSLLDNHLNISGKSISTRKKYSRTLRQFIITLNKLPEECNKNEIIAFFVSFKEENKISNSTLKNHIYSIKYYLKHIVDRIDLFDKIPTPVSKPFNINILNIHEINLLMESCKDCREKLIVQLLYETGIRISELVNLNINDFDLYNKFLVIRNSKNKKNRMVYFGDNLISTLIDYNNCYRNLFSHSLFTRKYNSFIRISKSTVRRVLKNIVKRCGINKRVTPHSLRHAFAVHYLNFGGTLYQLQKLLGHSHLETTFHYLQHATLPDSMNISILDKLFEIKQNYDLNSIII